MRSSLSLPKLWFVFSLVVLSFLVGYLSNKRGWFPKSYLDKVIQQARTTYHSWSPPMLASRVYDRAGTRVVDSTKVQPGSTFMTSVWEGPSGWRPGFRLIDRKGDKIHEWLINRERLFPDSLGPYRADPGSAIIHGSHLLPNGDVVFNLEYVGTARIDACGNVKWRLPKQGHHSVDRADDGTFWVSGGRWSDQVKKEYLGSNSSLISDNYWVDEILKISKKGELIKRINVIELIFENKLEYLIPKGWIKNVNTGDPTHINDVEKLEKDISGEYENFDENDLLVSLRHINLVFVFDTKSKNILWHTSRYLIGQHDPDFLGKGWIGVFNNREDFTRRGTLLGGSQITAFQPDRDSMRVLFPTQYSEPFYTARQGKWQRLGNGNMLLTETEAGRVVEVDSSGRSVWEYIREPYSESRVPSVKSATRVDLTREEVASWPCSSVDSVSTAQKQ